MITIIINATAARSSGALTIVQDFVSFLSKKTIVGYYFVLLTTTNNIFHNTKNVRVFELQPQNWVTRLTWDRFGFQKWCKKNNYFPDAVISFQNTCPRLTGTFKDVKLLVYYHQPLPLIKYSWKWYRSDERKLFLYAHFYGFFVNRWNKNAEYVVQIPFIKDLFIKKFPNIGQELVHVIRPNLPKINVNQVIPKEKPDCEKILIFPATPLRYKNHSVIIRAIEYLRNGNCKCLDNLKIIFTVPQNSFIFQMVFEKGLDDIINCIGNIPYEDLISYYKSSTALLFPSEIESFGLPLIEAALFGIPIIAADLVYAREVLENYANVTFVNTKDYISWANAIKQLLAEEKTLTPLKIDEKNAWEDFIALL